MSTADIGPLYPTRRLTKTPRTASQLASAGEPRGGTTSDQAPETRRRPPGLEPGPARTLALLSLALLTLLGLVALASRGDRPFAGGGPGREPSHAFWDYLFSLSLAVGAICFGIVVWGLLKHRGAVDLAQQRKQTRLLGTVFLVAMLVGMAIAVRSIDGFPGIRSDQQGVARGTPDPSTKGARDIPEPYTPDFRLLPVLLLAGAVLAAIVGAALVRERRRRRRRPATTEGELAEQLAALLDDTLDDLRAEPDPRRAVIAAYARMERALGGYGFPRRPFEAPLEYLDRIAAPLHEALPAARRLVFELTHLFERAKFSSHAVDREMQQDAIGTLASLRDELRAGEEAA